MKSYFAIIAAMRTGSNLLEKTIECFGDTVCYGEPFNRCFVGGPRKQELVGWDLKSRDQNPLAMLEDLISAEPRLIPGFRIFDDHSPEVLAKILKDPRCAKIVLKREPLHSYVSLLIARQTDQWMLRNVRRRRSARVTFDAVEFERYDRDMQAHYQMIADSLDAAQQQALWIDYDDLSDRRKLNEVAQYIGSSGQAPKDPPLLRQNPGCLRDKVTNYREMRAALGLETEHQLCPGSFHVYAPASLPIAFAPIQGPAALSMLALMQRLEASASHKNKLSRSAILSQIAGEHLFPELQADASGRPVFTMVCHPAIRAHGLFLWEMFGPNWKASDVRKAAIARYPEIPKPSVAERNGLPSELHGQAFDIFLEHLELQVTRDASLSSSVRSQQETLLSYKQRFIDLRVLRYEKFENAARDVALISGLLELARGQQRSIRLIGRVGSLNSETVLTPARLDRIAKIWPSDYADLSYDLRPKKSEV